MTAVAASLPVRDGVMDGLREEFRSQRQLSDSDEAERAAYRKFLRRNSEKVARSRSSSLNTSNASVAPAHTTPSPLPGEPLSQEISRVTRQLHRSSESLVQAKLALALFDRDGVSYASALRLYLPVFLNLEKLQLVYRDNAAIRRMPMRKGLPEAVLKDLHHFNVSVATMPQKELEAAAAYVARMRDVSQDTPELLCAYIYCMNMALLAGGALMRGAVARALRGASDEGGLCVFALPPGSKDAREAQAALREAMDEVGRSVDTDTRAAIVAEAQKVFELNNSLVRVLHLGVRRREIARGFVLVGNGSVLGAAVAAAALQCALLLCRYMADVM